MSLAGKRIVITRPPDQATSFAEQLKMLGAVPVSMPTITIQPPADSEPIKQALQHIDQYDWVLFTSANAVHHVCQHVTTQAVNWPNIAVIGPATAEALEEYGLNATIIAEEHVAEGLFEALKAQVTLQEKRILLPQAKLARPVLAHMLQEVGALVDVVVAYETVKPDVKPALLSDAFDAITFTSSSSVQNFVELFDKPLALIGEAIVACIGPVTAETAHELGLPVHAVADPHTIDGLITALEEAFERKSVV